MPIPAMRRVIPAGVAPLGRLLWFLPPRHAWRRLTGAAPSRLLGGGGEPPGRGPGRRGDGGGSHRWPVWLAVLATTVLAAALTMLSMMLTIVAGDAGPPYPPGP